jgi:hypothetical protein
MLNYNRDQGQMGGKAQVDLLVRQSDIAAWTGFCRICRCQETDEKTWF